MKHVFTLLAAAILLVCTPASAQTSKEIRKAKKLARTEAKALENEGYKLSEIGDLKAELTDYILESMQGKEQIIGTSGPSASLNLAKLTAENSALNEYVNRTGGMVKARITSDLSNVDGVQRDNIVAAFERMAVQEVKNDVKFCFTVVKEQRRQFDVRVYCLVDSNDAHNAMMKALEHALQELGMAEQYGSKVSEWIQE
jgi:hypothetical protein